MFYRGSIVKSFEDPLPVLPKKAKKEKKREKKNRLKSLLLILRKAKRYSVSLRTPESVMMCSNRIKEKFIK